MKHAVPAIFIILLAIMPAASCSVITDAYNVPNAEGSHIQSTSLSGAISPNRVTDEAPSAIGEGYTLLVASESLTPALYEPKFPQGCYLGAYVLRDRRINGSMASFDTLMKKEHAIYAYTAALDEEFPSAWVLECVANFKTPLIILTPPSNADSYLGIDKNLYDEKLMVKWAKAAGELNIPVFVQFYPYSKGKGYIAYEYKKFVKKAYQAFSDNAPNAAFVWGIALDDISETSRFYPGDDFCDWVGLSIMADIGKDGSYTNFIDDLDSYYLQFQTAKPIMLSLSLSHFTTLDNRYYTNYCAQALSGVYAAASSRYPRVRAIIYMDYTSVGVSQPRAGKVQNNYLLTDEELLVSAYSQAVSFVAFLGSLSSPEPIMATYSITGASFTGYIKSRYNAVFFDGQFYITKKSLLEYGEHISSALAKKPIVTIGGEKYYSMKTLLDALGADFYVDADNRVLYLDFVGKSEK